MLSLILHLLQLWKRLIIALSPSGIRKGHQRALFPCHGLALGPHLWRTFILFLLGFVTLSTPPTFTRLVNFCHIVHIQWGRYSNVSPIAEDQDQHYRPAMYLLWWCSWYCCCCLHRGIILPDHTKQRWRPCCQQPILHAAPVASLLSAGASLLLCFPVAVAVAVARQSYIDNIGGPSLPP